MRIFLVRHGEMTGDPFVCPERPVSGCLSEKGINQTEALSEKLQNVDFKLAYSSPFGRALQTAGIILRNRDIPIKVLPFLHEWLPNPSLNNLPETEFEKINQQYNTSYAEETWKTELGEGCFDMYARICPPFLSELHSIGIHSRFGGFVIDDAVVDTSILVVAHGGSLNILLSFILEVRPFPASKFRFDLTGVGVLDFIKFKGIYYPQLVIPSPN